MGLCNPLEDTESLIRETAGYIDDADHLAEADPIMARDATGVCVKERGSVGRVGTLCDQHMRSRISLEQQVRGEMIPTSNVYPAAKRVCDRLLLESSPRKGGTKRNDKLAK